MIAKGRDPQSARILGPVSRKPRKRFGPVKPLQNLEPCDYRAVLFTYSKDEGRFPSYKKFQAYIVLHFLDTDNLKMALRARKLSGAFEKRAQDVRRSVIK